jgi:membrane protein YqaA with SNARE-associated domain
VIHFAHAKHGATALFVLSFAESSFFPIPPDVLLGPLALGAPKKWLRFALACSIASVLGGILGYCIGMFLWQAIGQWVFAHFAWAHITPENFILHGHILRLRTFANLQSFMTNTTSGLSSPAALRRCLTKSVPYPQVWREFISYGFLSPRR